MSFIIDRIKALDAQLDRLQLGNTRASTISESQNVDPRERLRATSSTATTTLRASIKSLSLSTRPDINVCETHEVIQALENVTFQVHGSSNQSDFTEDVESNLLSDLEWHLVGKAAIRTYGIVLNDLVNQVSSINSSSWYWTGVLSSSRSLSIYSIQNSPLRLWQRMTRIFNDVYQHGNVFENSWQRFHLLVRSMMRQRFLTTLQHSLVSPLAVVHAEVVRKQSHLEQMKLSVANCIGCLLRFGFEGLGHWESPKGTTNSREIKRTDQCHEWRNMMLRSVTTLDVIMETLISTQLVSDKLEDNSQQSIMWNTPVAQVEEDWNEHRSLDAINIKVQHPADAAQQILHILKTHLPRSQEVHDTFLTLNGTPSRFIRFWLPLLSLTMVSTTVLGVYIRQKNAIIHWIQDIGATVIDFWTNWVVEPSKKVIGTIRHDEASEVSILSRKSLEGDRSSLERMVVDFAIDTSRDSPLDEMQLAAIRDKIRQGDLTPVLRVYEQEMQRPVYGSLRGSLIRALLIQVQKTKVDVEVAMGGIDSLLKSQELVFGFVGLTPGLLVCFGVMRWLGSLSTNRRSSEQRRKASQTLHLLRNIDRILNAAECEPTTLTFERYGLLVCEAVGIHDIARKTFPEEVFQDFLVDFNELIGSFQSLVHQRRVADRLRWSYWKWL